MSYSTRAAHHVRLLLLASWCVAMPLLTAGKALAQDSESFSLDESAEGSDKQAAQPASAGEQPELLSDEQAIEEEQAPDELYRKSTDPWEDPKKNYFFVGGAWRFVRLPAWTSEWFLESAPSVGTAGSFFGEFGYRNDGFQVTGSIGYLGWNFKGPFQLSGDQEVDTEWLDGDFKFLMGSATFTWSTAFTDWFALEYGLEVGLAALFGELVRTEGYRDTNGKWGRCPGWAGGPDLPQSEVAANPDKQYAQFCDRPVASNGAFLSPEQRTNSADENGAHYGVKATQVPPVVPILGPRLSLRFKPIAQLVLRVDIPLPVAPFGFMGGLAASYGI